MERYTTAAQVLRMLSAAEPVCLNGREDPLRTMLRAGAEACEQVVDAGHEGTKALRALAETRRLLIQLIDGLDARLSTHDDLWSVYMLARRALDCSTGLLASDELEQGRRE
jgi:hypothetical protein